MLSFFKHSRSLVNLASSPLGSYQTNCYIMDFDDHFLILDPGSEANIVLGYLKKFTDKKNVNIYLTHGHFDHTGAVPEICEAYPDAKVYASENDMGLYTKPNLNLSSSTGNGLSLKNYLDRFVYVKDGEIISLGNEKFGVIDIPGHTPGSTGLKIESQKYLFSGDTLFQGSIGNTELPLGNFALIMKSIMEKLYPLDDDIIVFPGHGNPTTIGEEKKTNPFILAEVNKKIK